jgi:hypothetical protein
MRVSPAKAAINLDRAIAEKLMGAWLPCRENSASQWPAQSNCRLKAEDGSPRGLRLQNPRSDPIWFAKRSNLQRVQGQKACEEPAGVINAIARTEG